MRIEESSRAIMSAHANALEFLENTLNPTVRTLLLPLIDSEVSVAERIRRADTFLNTRVVSHEDAIAALVHSEDPWLKSCGVYAIGKLRLKTFDAELERLAQRQGPAPAKAARRSPCHAELVGVRRTSALFLGYASRC